MGKRRPRQSARAVLRPISGAVRTAQANSGRFESRLVWVFGSPRSGSTWLLNMLGRHPAVFPIYEPLIGWYLGPFHSDGPGGDPRSLSTSTFTLRRVQANQENQFFAEQYSDVWLPNLARMMRERFFAQAVRGRGGGWRMPQCVVIKEPNGSQSADLIMRALPRAKLLFLLRDGRDVVDSDLAANLKGAWVSSDFPGMSGISDEDRLSFVVQSAQKWLWRTEVVQAAMASHPGPSHTVRYEDLRSEPRAQIREILDWLDLLTADTDLTAWVDQYSFEREARTGPGQFARSAKPGAWRENLRPHEQEAVMELLEPKLRELGYEA